MDTLFSSLRRTRGAAARPCAGEPRSCASLREYAGGVAAVGLVAAVGAALALASPRSLPAQDLLLARSTPAGTARSAGGPCAGMPAWLSVDGRLGAAAVARDGRRALLGFTRDRPGRGAGRTSLRVVDLVTGRPLVTVELGEFGQVTDLWPSHEGTRVWIAAEEGGRVLTVDSRTGKLLMVWEMGRTSRQAGAVSAGDRYLYVTNREAGTLTLIDRATVGARTVELGRGVGSLDVSERGRRTVWVANEELDELVAVSGRTGEILARMPSGGRGPVHVRARPGTDEVWVAHRQSGEIVVVDGRDREIVDRIPLDSPPGRIAFSDDGSVGFVSLPAGDRVLRMDGATRTVAGPAPPGVPAGSLGAVGCGLARLVAGGACADRSLDPWLAADGLPPGWVDDEEVVAGSLCGSRERGNDVPTAGSASPAPEPPADRSEGRP